MRTIRRLYFYAVTFVSLEVVLWGLIGLARSIFHSGNIASSLADRLAQSLALILVGVPVFGFHWWTCQRDASRSSEERNSGVRAVFLYAALLATLIPIVQNLLALLDRVLLGTARLNTRLAFFGGTQTWGDNLIAVVMNALLATYFILLMRNEWKEASQKESLTLVRRIYRIIWLFYGLVMVIAGTQQTLRFVFDLAGGPFGSMMHTSLVHGVTLLVIGSPIWFFAWKTIQDGLSDTEESESLLRLGVLYFLSLAGVVVVLTAAGMVVDTLLRLVFGQPISLQQVIGRINSPLAIGIPLGGVWAYYGRWLGRAISATADSTRRSGMRRLYYYILAAIGLGAGFTGVAMTVTFLIDRLVLGLAPLGTLTGGLALLSAGLPLWLFTWRPMQVESLAQDDAGSHARRSLLRRIYLYLALFASVVGGIISAVSLLFQLLRALLGQPPANLADQVLRLACLLLLFIGLDVYHGLTLKKDGKLASVALSDRHAAFPVLLFDPGEGEFAGKMLAHIQKQAPSLPVTVQPANQPMAKTTTAKAVILPADLALDPPEALRRWLGKYDGHRLAVPCGETGWILPGSSHSDLRQAALAVRQLAEGHTVHQKNGSPGWLIVVYIAAGLFALEFLFTLFSLVMSLFMN